jgi:hypothetical protein
MAVHTVPIFSDPRYANALTSSMAGFLASIGLETAPVVLSEAGFLDGLMISHGVLLIDGHLAVVPGAQRKLLYGNAGSDPGEEMAAIAWSYAAALYLGIDPAVVFHPNGYSGGSEAILLNFSQGRYFGVPMLEWFGLTADKKTAALLKVSGYPHMLKWLRD